DHAVPEIAQLTLRALDAYLDSLYSGPGLDKPSGRLGHHAGHRRLDGVNVEVGAERDLGTAQGMGQGGAEIGRARQRERVARIRAGQYLQADSCVFNSSRQRALEDEGVEARERVGPARVRDAPI